MNAKKGHIQDAIWNGHKYSDLTLNSIFHEDGIIDQIILMGDIDSGLKFFYRLPPDRYHTMLIKSEVLVFHEITNGPFMAHETSMASWSPEETDLDAVSQYMTKLAKLTLNEPV